MSWEPLPDRDWAPTIRSLHMWSQMVGKVRMALATPVNRWWHVTLYVTTRGLTTSPIPYFLEATYATGSRLAHWDGADERTPATVGG